MNCSMDARGGDISNATEVRTASAGVCWGAEVALRLSATRQVTAVTNTAGTNHASVKGFILVLYQRRYPRSWMFRGALPLITLFTCPKVEEVGLRFAAVGRSNSG